MSAASGSKKMIHVRFDKQSANRNFARHELAELSNEELAFLFQQDIMPAFDELVARFKDPLMNYLYWYVGDYEIAGDLLQETFIRLYEKKHRYRRVAKFTTWVYTIAGNLAKDELRRRRRHFTFSIFRKSKDEEPEFPTPSNDPLPDRLAESAMLGDHIQDALLQIPAMFREAVILSDVQQFSYPEIAEIMHMPLGTVKSRINRGRRELKKILKDVH